MDLCEFEASLGFRVSSRTGSKSIQSNPVLKNKKKTNQKRAKMYWAHSFGSFCLQSLTPLFLSTTRQDPSEGAGCETKQLTP